MNDHSDAPVIIKLDDPTPRSTWFITVLIALAVVSLFIAPVIILDRSATEEERLVPLAPSSQQMCRPMLETPAFLNPVTNLVLPGFVRLCDWLAPPDWLPADRSWGTENVVQPLPSRVDGDPRRVSG